ncbi:hypothetical protein [Micromonospora endolithica]|uniref:LPXTG cell wall anchor domain-containing protein n=1 Tax=Micromonospora endolithica TaxID=230091 RepID=A0A3A9YQI5_9ACTN|nr:hypothetical protein [Micromonospora endolithica]RKN38252.1 hypothetical protein D7223_31420 [Micromonospora endolithica]
MALSSAPPAFAAPGDASARGVVVDLSAAVAGVPIITADAVIGSATAPPGGGTDTDTALAITIPGALGVTAAGTVVEVSATRGETASSANAEIADLALAVLGTPVIDAEVISAAVACPQTGAQTADTTFTGLELFGEPIELLPNTPGVTASAAVTVVGLTGAALNATLTNVETVTDDGAIAIAVQATLRLTGTVVGGPLLDIPVGTVILAEARCERPLGPSPTPTPTVTPTQPTPAPTQPTAPPTQPTQPTQPPTTSPDPILPVTGDDTTTLWWLLGIGAVMVTAGGAGMLITRRNSPTLDA